MREIQFPSVNERRTGAGLSIGTSNYNRYQENQKHTEVRHHVVLLLRISIEALPSHSPYILYSKLDGIQAIDLLFEVSPL